MSVFFPSPAPDRADLPVGTHRIGWGAGCLLIVSLSVLFTSAGDPAWADEDAAPTPSYLSTPDNTPLEDPTRPDTHGERAAPSLARGPWRISLLLVGEQRSMAVVNGVQVGVGAKLGPGRVEAIDREGVTLELDGARIRLRQNVCLRIEEGRGGRRALQQEGLCQGEAGAAALAGIPLQRDARGTLWVEVRLNEGYPLRLRLDTEAARSRLPRVAWETTAQASPTSGRGDGEGATGGKRRGRMKKGVAGMLMVETLRMGGVVLREVAFQGASEGEGVLGRDVLNRLGGWRLDSDAPRLVLEP